jgi:tetratricopeptide (TPR) repeat protein
MFSGRRHAAPALLVLVAMAVAAAGAAAHPEPSESIAALGFALERHPDDPLLWIERAGQYLLVGDPAAALRDLDRAESLAPYRPDVPLQRGAALLALGRAADAERQLGLAIERDPSSEQARVLRGRARLALDRPRDAARDFQRAIELSAHPSPDQYLEWARALDRAARIGDALEALDRGFAAVGQSPALAEEAVRLECERGAWDEALDRIERHPGAWGPDAARRARRGDVLRAAGRELEAQAEYSAALAELEAGSSRHSAGAAALEARLHQALRQGTPVTGRP